MSVDEYNRLIDEMANCLKRKVQEGVAGKEWKLAYMDCRSPADGSSWISKLRIKLADATVMATAHTPMDARAILPELWDAKRNAFSKTWYGFTLTVFPNKKHEITYNYDADCINDPSFYPK